MTTLREAAQQALKAMEKATRFMSDSDYKKLNQAIDDLRAALAEPPFEVNFCARCGKRVRGIHTCTPPHGIG